MGQNHRIVVTLDSVLDSVDLAEDVALRVAEAAGFDEEDRHKLGMSVREAVINALQYGNKMRPEKKARLTLQLCPDKLEIRVLDQGPGFNLADVPDPLAEENLLRSSGRGILLMRSFMDEFDVLQHATGGAELVMALRYRPAPNGGGSGTAQPKEESA
jgi:serine/threonine-protein kinase RsbW